MRWLVVIALAACGDDALVEPGCPPETVPSSDGDCEAPGVPPTLCPVGFVPDGAGCAPVVPATRCPDGLVAVPGEMACHAVGVCPDSGWGNVPVTPGSLYVDAAYPGTDSDGSAAKPYRRIQNAIDVAPVDSTIAIAAGEYDENLVAYRQVKLWGVCADRVQIVAAFVFPENGNSATVRFYPYADGSELHGVSLGGYAVGLDIDGANHITVDHVRFRSSLATGAVVHSSYYGYTGDLTVRDSLFERGVDNQGERLTLESVVVRATNGVHAEPGQYIGRRPRVVIRRSIIEDNLEAGIALDETDAIVEDVIVRNTRPLADGYGTGIALTGGTAALVRGALIEANHDAGVRVGAGSHATLEALVVRGTRQRALERKGGHGIAIAGCPVDHVCDAELRTTATIYHSLLQDNQEAGISVTGADATIDRVLVEGTLLGSDGVVGDGIVVLDDGVRATALVTRTRSVDNVRAGLASFGGELTLGANVMGCNEYDLDADYSEVLDLGGNRCGCGDVAACTATPGDLVAPLRSW